MEQDLELSLHYSDNSSEDDQQSVSEHAVLPSMTQKPTINSSKETDHVPNPTSTGTFNIFDINVAIIFIFCFIPFM